MCWSLFIFLIVVFDLFIKCNALKPRSSLTNLFIYSSSLVGSQSYNATLTQPIIISDTPSPAVSVITIHSDSEEEDERKFHPRYLPAKICLYFLSVIFLSVKVAH